VRRHGSGSATKGHPHVPRVLRYAPPPPFCRPSTRTLHPRQAKPARPGPDCNAVVLDGVVLPFVPFLPTLGAHVRFHVTSPYFHHPALPCLPCPACPVLPALPACPACPACLPYQPIHVFLLSPPPPPVHGGIKRSSRSVHRHAGLVTARSRMRCLCSHACPLIMDGGRWAAGCSSPCRPTYLEQQKA
jgi:hypothetical protein